MIRLRSHSRWLGLLLLLVPMYALRAESKPKLGPSHVFKLKMEGKSWQTGVILNPGVKPPIGTVTTKTVGDVLKGILPDYAEDFLDLDPEGTFYLFYDSKSEWRVATNPQGDDATTLRGQVANDGTFWMAGKYSLFMANADVFVQGKVTFKKGTFEPTKVKGKFFLVSEDITTGLTLKIETGQKVSP